MYATQGCISRQYWEIISESHIVFHDTSLFSYVDIETRGRTVSMSTVSMSAESPTRKPSAGSQKRPKPRQRGLGSHWQPIERDPAEGPWSKAIQHRRLARSTFRVIQRAAEEIRDRDTFSFSDGQVPDAELCRFFAGRQELSTP